MGQLFVYLVTIVGTTAGLIRPIYGLCAYMVLAIIRPEVVWEYTVEPGSYSRIVAIGMLIGWALHGFGGLRFGPARVPAAAIFLFWCWALFASMAATYQIEPWIFMENLTKIVLPILVGITLINTKKDLVLIAWTIGLSSAFLAVRENDTYLAWGVGEGDNQTAHTMAAIFGFLFFLGMGCKSWIFRLLFIGGAMAAAHAVMFHMSRGAMLGLAVCGAFVLLLAKKTPLYYGMVVCAGLAAARLAGPQVVEEFFTMFNESEALDDSAISRTVFWRAMAQCTVENPLFGVGPHNWPTVSPLYGIPNREGHGAWQQLAAETGVPGISFLMLYYGYLIAKLLPLALGFRGPESDELRPYAQMFITSFCGWFVAQIFGSFYLVEFPYYIAMLAAGVLKVAPTLTADGGQDELYDDERLSAEPEYLDDELQTAGEAIS